MKKTFKILGLIFVTLFALLCLGLFLFFLKLPSPAELGRSFMRKPVVQAVPAQSQENVDRSQIAVQISDASAESAVPEPVKESSGNLDVNNSRDMQALENLMDAEQPYNQVCENLRAVQLVPDDFRYDKKVFDENFKSALMNDRTEKDPMILAVLAPVRFFLQQPKMQALLRKVVNDSRDGGDSSLIGKAQFYAELVGVYQEMKAAKRPAEHLMDRGYHLVMLARIVKKNPSLISDSQLSEYCQKIEKAANQGSPVDWQMEKEEFQNLMSELNIQPSEIGYDPKYKTELVLQKSEKGMTFQGGWIDEIFPNQNVNIGGDKDSSN